jgi:hypothetical protein
MDALPNSIEVQHWKAREVAIVVCRADEGSIGTTGVVVIDGGDRRDGCAEEREYMRETHIFGVVGSCESKLVRWCLEGREVRKVEGGRRKRKVLATKTEVKIKLCRE